MDGDSCGLVWVGSSLGCHYVHLPDHWPPCVDHAILEYDCCVPEYEIYSAIDVAISVKLSLGVGVESVLVTFEATTVEDGEVRAGTKGYGLVVLRTGSVAECDAVGDKSITCHS